MEGVKRAKRSDMTEEEWKERRREQKRKSNEKHKDERNRRRREKYANDPEYRKKIGERKKKYYEDNGDLIREKAKEKRAADPEKYRARSKKWREDNPDKKSEQNRKYRETHLDYYKDYLARYYRDNKDELIAYSNDYSKEKYKTPAGRAMTLEYTYKSIDGRNGLPTENNVSKEWILENIFGGQKCIYCGDSDWSHLGCDRIDNSKPHTPDNVVCACGVCNIERNDRYTVEEFIEHRKTHPRDLTRKPMNGFDFVEQNGVKVLKKKEITL